MPNLLHRQHGGTRQENDAQKRQFAWLLCCCGSSRDDGLTTTTTSLLCCRCCVGCCCQSRLVHVEHYTNRNDACMSSAYTTLSMLLIKPERPLSTTTPVTKNTTSVCLLVVRDSSVTYIEQTSKVFALAASVGGKISKLGILESRSFAN
jgi:hypothetical protein